MRDAVTTRELIYFSCDVLSSEHMKGLAIQWLEDGQQAGQLGGVPMSETACALMA